MKHALTFWTVALVSVFLVASCGDSAPRKAQTRSTANNTNNENNLNNTNNENNLNNLNNAELCGNESVDPGESCDSGISSGPGSCPNLCPQMRACSVGRVVGTAAACTAECVYDEISECIDGDGCCPPSCSAESDNDCSATCGNDTIDDNETCEGDCPTSCDDSGACTTTTLVGSAANCNSECESTPITTCVNDDGCCPDDCNANNDNDCDPECGNGIEESGETCDGDCPTCDDGNVCTADSISGSPSECDVVCSNTPITACQSGDGCCSNGCTYSTDRDCPCQPIACGTAGRECGTPDDGCGTTLNCPNCSPGERCDNYTCVPISTTLTIGDACTNDNECGSGNFCADNPNYKNGYCSRDCDLDNDCPGGSHCTFNSNSTGQCMKNCFAANDCRDGYECFDADEDLNATKECAPAGVGTRQIGDDCTGVYQCSGAAEAWCVNTTNASPNFCSVSCGPFDFCPIGAVCDGAFTGGWCLDECTSGGGDCRPGFTCTEFFSVVGPDRWGCQAN